jgi:hypothetical protein
VDGLEKDLAQINALSTASAERLREHRVEAGKLPNQVNAAEEHEKTLAGVAIGTTWDLLLGKAGTSQARVDRAHKADEYAEIAADTFASIPKFSAIAGGVAHSVLLIDVSGQSSAGDVAKGMALNFMQGAALNSVTRMAGSESVVGKLVSGRLGAGIGAEVVTHAISGGGYGLVKSSLSERSWMDGQGNFSLATGLKNVATSTSVGTLIGIPAGMAGLRVGRAVTLGLGNQVEHSAVASTVQKFAVGAGSGFASGSVFGGVDAAKSGKSWNQILDSTLQGGMVGLVTGGVAGGWDRTPGKTFAAGDEHARAAAEIESQRLARPGGKSYERDLGQGSLTERMVERADYLMAPRVLRDAYDRLSYKPTTPVRMEDFSGRLKPPVVEERTAYGLKDSAPKTYEEYQTALKSLNAGGEPLDFTKHFWDPFVESSKVPMRIYAVAGHSTKIVVPEEYARQLEEVRTLRKAAQNPSSYDTLTWDQKVQAFASMKNGDASALREFMSPPELTKYIQVYQAKMALRSHPLGDRALPEDLVPILDALPNRRLLKEVNLLDRRNMSDVFKSMVYEAPGFQAAATVGRDAIVDLYQANHGTALYNTVFHEWSHVAKWQSPVFSKMFDLASVVDHVDSNLDHKATANVRQNDPTHEEIRGEGMYYPDLHSTRSQDENFAVGLGEETMGPDPNNLFTYIGRAPVRGMTLAVALENHLNASRGRNESSMADNMMDRAHYASEAARPYAIGTLQTKMATGTPVEKAAAAQLMAHFGTREQVGDLVAVALDKANRVVPQWKGTAAEAAMGEDGRTVAQHAYDSYMNLMHKGDSPKSQAARFSESMALMLQEPALRDVAADYVARSSDPRLANYGPLLKMYDPHGTPVQRVAGVELIKAFGGQDKADMLLSIAMDKSNDHVPNFRGTDIPPEFARKFRTVAQTAYSGYIEASAVRDSERAELAFKNGLEKPNQRELASRYLLKSWDDRAQGFGKFLEMHDLPGHVVKMQELIDSNFKHDGASQKMVFDQMMHLTDSDPRRQMELISANLHEPALMDNALAKMESILGRGTTRQQREEMNYAVTERMRWENYSAADKTRMTNLLGRVEQENKVQDALALIRTGHGDRVAAVHELSVLHDQRAIKPLLQQAVSGNDAVEQEAIGALRQFNPTLVKFYAQELKREYGGNPVLIGKITDLLGSKKWASPVVAPSSTQASLQ